MAKRRGTDGGRDGALLPCFEPRQQTFAGVVQTRARTLSVLQKVVPCDPHRRDEQSEVKQKVKTNAVWRRKLAACKKIVPEADNRRSVWLGGKCVCGSDV